jgi:hypothetical protein
MAVKEKAVLNKLLEIDDQEPKIIKPAPIRFVTKEQTNFENFSNLSSSSATPSPNGTLGIIPTPILPQPIVNGSPFGLLTPPE